MALTFSVSALSGSRLALPKMSMARNVPSTLCSDVTTPGETDGSDGPRNVEPAEARSANHSANCQRAEIFGSNVEPVLPP